MESFCPQSSDISNGRSNLRFFGKDLTNLDNQVYSAKDNLAANKSNLNGSGRDCKGKGLGKPTPFQFYKGIFENQRMMHKRSATNDVNKSASIDVKEVGSKNRERNESIDNEGQIKKSELVKLQLSKFLKSKSNIGDRIHSEEAEQQNQIAIQDFNASQHCFDLRNSGFNREPTPGTFTTKFSSISAMLGSSKNSQQRPASISIGVRQSPHGPLIPGQFQGCQLEHEKSLNPGLKKMTVSNKSNSLRTHNDCFKKLSACIRPSQLENLSPSREDCASMHNELDLLNSLQNHRSKLFREFDVPFMWNFMISQEVGSGNSEKYVFSRVFRSAPKPERSHEKNSH